MATLKSALVTASCGLMLLGAVAAQAKITTNGANPNGANPNGLTIDEHIGHTPGTPLSPGLPFNGLSHSGLGKPAIDARTP